MEEKFATSLHSNFADELDGVNYKNTVADSYSEVSKECCYQSCNNMWLITRQSPIRHFNLACGTELGDMTATTATQALKDDPDKYKPSTSPR